MDPYFNFKTEKTTWNLVRLVNLVLQDKPRV